MRSLLQERVSLATAVELAGRIIACFPNGGQSAARSYIGALAAILVSYPRVIAEKSPDPICGVPRECKFLPTCADLIAWCERELASMRQPVEIEDRQEQIKQNMQEQREEDNYWQKARTMRPTLDELRARHGPNWGLGTQRDPLDRRAPPIPWDKQVPAWKDIVISEQLKKLLNESPNA